VGCSSFLGAFSANEVDATKLSANPNASIFREIISHPSVFQIVSYYTGPFIFGAMDLRKVNSINTMVLPSPIYFGEELAGTLPGREKITTIVISDICMESEL